MHAHAILLRSFKLSPDGVDAVPSQSEVAFILDPLFATTLLIRWHDWGFVLVVCSECRLWLNRIGF